MILQTASVYLIRQKRHWARANSIHRGNCKLVVSLLYNIGECKLVDGNVGGKQLNRRNRDISLNTQLIIVQNNNNCYYHWVKHRVVDVVPVVNTSRGCLIPIDGYKVVTVTQDSRLHCCNIIIRSNCKYFSVYVTLT